jgi:tetratricopeptide (TPR) repeat protein
MNRLQLLNFVASLFFLAQSCLFAADQAPAPAAAPAGGLSLSQTGRFEDTNAQDTIRSYLQVQEQLHATQLAIERYRKEADEASAQNARALAENARIISDRLKSIEATLGDQRKRELETMQSSNRVMLFIAGVFAVIGLLALLVMGWFQSRALGRLAEVSTKLPLLRGLPTVPSLQALGPGDSTVTVGAAEQSSIRLMSALETLEKRILGLEHLSHFPATGLLRKTPTEATAAMPGDSQGSELAKGTPAKGNGAVIDPETTRMTSILNRGQALLDDNKLDEALACFEEALKLQSGNAEALVKKGSVLERLRKSDEAIACYDEAIAADSTLTIAWLYKGGLFNRLQRYTEALECYERALHSQERRGG